MAQNQKFNQNLETPSYLINLQSLLIFTLDDEPNLLEYKDLKAPCQTPRECQTRSYASGKKPSKHQQAQHLSATTTTTKTNSELDLPQSGSEDDDEAWLTESTESWAKAEPAGTINQAEANAEQEPPLVNI